MCDLTVYFKNGVPILHYEHKKTKTKIVVPVENFNSVDLKEFVFKIVKFLMLLFLIMVDYTLHFAEHCIATDMEYLAYN